MQCMNRFLSFITVMFFAVFVVSYAAAATPQTLRQDHPAAPPVDAAKLAGIPRGGFPRNIILIIGDGMGQGAINFASLTERPGASRSNSSRSGGWRAPRRPTAG